MCFLPGDRGEWVTHRRRDKQMAFQGELPQDTAVPGAPLRAQPQAPGDAPVRAQPQSDHDTGTVTILRVPAPRGPPAMLSTTSRSVPTCFRRPGPRCELSCRETLWGEHLPSRPLRGPGRGAVDQGRLMQRPRHVRHEDRARGSGPRAFRRAFLEVTEEPYDVTHTWAIKPKTMNKQGNEQKLRDTNSTVGVPRGEGVGGGEGEGKGGLRRGKSRFTSGGEHTIPQAHAASWTGTREPWVIG